MGFFDQNKALIITVLVFSVMLLAMYNIKLSNSNDEMVATLINLENMQVEEKEKREKEQTEEEVPETEQKTVQTHQAFNQNSQEKNQSFQSRLEEIFEKNSAESTAAEEDINSSTGSFNLSKNEEQKASDNSDGDNTSKEISTRTGTLENSSIAFSLLGRTAVDIPNPIYTCDSSGKIVVNITVDAEGRVTSTAWNEASSTSDNKCLIKQALEYASGAIFSDLPGRDEQIGTITYHFQG